jgi:hypothetical protein
MLIDGDGLPVVEEEGELGMGMMFLGGICGSEYADLIKRLSQRARSF